MSKFLINNIDKKYFAQKVASQFKDPIAMTTTDKLAFLLKQAAEMSFDTIAATIDDLKWRYRKDTGELSREIQKYLSKPEVFGALFEHVSGSNSYKAGVRTLLKANTGPGQFENYYHDAVSSLFDYGDSKSNLINYVVNHLDKSFNDAVFGAIMTNMQKAVYQNKNELQQSDDFERSVSMNQEPTTEMPDIDEQEEEGYNNAISRYFEIATQIRKKQQEGDLDLMASKAIARVTPYLQELEKINKENINNDHPDEATVVKAEDLIKSIEKVLALIPNVLQTKANYKKMGPEELSSALNGLLSQLNVLKTNLQTKLETEDMSEVEKAKIQRAIEKADEFATVMPRQFQEYALLGLEKTPQNKENREAAFRMFTTLEAFIDTNGKLNQGEVVKQTIQAKERGLNRQEIEDQLGELSPEYRKLIHHFHLAGNFPESKEGFADYRKGFMKMPNSFYKFYGPDGKQIGFANSDDVEQLKQSSRDSIVQGILNRSLIEFSLLKQQYGNQKTPLSGPEKNQIIKDLIRKEMKTYLSKFAGNTPIVSEYDKEGNLIQTIQLGPEDIENMYHDLDNSANTLVPINTKVSHYHLDTIPFLLEKASLLHMMENGEIPPVYQPGMSPEQIGQRIEQIKEIIKHKHYANKNLGFYRPLQGSSNRTKFNWTEPHSTQQEAVIDKALTHELQMMAKKMQNQEREAQDPTFITSKEERDAPMHYSIDPSESVGSTFSRTYGKKPQVSPDVPPQPDPDIDPNRESSVLRSMFNKYVRG